MRLLQWTAVLALVALAPAMTIDSRAQAPVSPVFHAIGDLPGGPTLSVIRDATRVGSTIYAVGGAATGNQVLCIGPNNPVGCSGGAFATDTPVLWTFDGISATLAALPTLVTVPSGAGTSSEQASAISPNGAFIASQTRFNTANFNQRTAVRVTTSALPAAAANLSLLAAPYNGGVGANPQSVTDDGNVLYGNTTLTGGVQRAARFDVGNAAGNVAIPPLSAFGHTNSQIALRGASANGLVAVGTSFVQPYAGSTNGHGFRFVWNSTTNTGSLGAIVEPAGATWSKALGVSPDGQWILAAANSLQYSSGETYLVPPSGPVVELGSPNSYWIPSGIAGMTADHAVVVTTYSSPVGATRFGYVHNSHGWFMLTSLLGAAGIDLHAQGWDTSFLQIAGVSGDGTLVYGNAFHNGNNEGFVIDFPPGYLANFDVPAVPPTDTSIVGAWSLVSQPGGNNGTGVVVFMKDGTYYIISADAPAGQSGTNGFERGTYRWDPVTGQILVTTRLDTDGDQGISDSNGRFDLTVSVSGDTMTVNVPGDGVTTLSRLPTDLASMTGAWVAGDPTVDNSSSVAVFLGDGTYFMAQDGGVDNGLGGRDGMELGTWAWDPSTGVITTTTTQDTNGDWGFSNPIGAERATLGPDGLTGLAGDDSGQFPILRIIDPNAVRPVITSASPVTGTVGVALSYTATATFHPSTFSAAGLPPGLGIDGPTGVVSGVPTTVGAYNVDVSATNTLATGTGLVRFDINPISCTAGNYRANLNDVACTPAPAGSYVPADGATAAIPCPAGLSSDAGAIVCVDRTPPTIDTVANIAATTSNLAGAVVTYTSPASHDSHDGDGVASCAPASGTTFPVGSTSVTCTAQDAAGNPASVSFTVSVTYQPPANRAPVCSAATPSVTSVWPPNHQWIPVSILGVTDPDGDAVTIKVTGIFQDEPTNSAGDGNSWIDGMGVGTATASIRAERAGGDDDRKGRGNGRVYHIRFTATDGKASCSGDVTVGVPQSRNGAAVDDGPLFDSTRVTASTHRQGDKCDHDLGRNGHRAGDGCDHERGR